MGCPFTSNSTQNKDFFFGSETKYIQSLAGNKFITNETLLKKNLIYGYKSIHKSNETYFKNIFSFNKSTYSYVDYANNLSTRIYWKPNFREDDVYWRYPVIYRQDREKLINKAKYKGLVITKHYPANNKHQSYSNLKIANLLRIFGETFSVNELTDWGVNMNYRKNVKN